MASLLRAAASAVSGAPRLLGQGLQGLQDVAKAAPKASLQDVLGALPKAGALPALDPRAAAAAAADLAGILNPSRAASAAGSMNPQDAAKRTAERTAGFLGNAAQSALGSGAQSTIEATNDIFAALGIQIWIVHPNSRLALTRVRVQGLDENGQSQGELRKGMKLTPREFVGLLRDARKEGQLHKMDGYVGRMVEEGRLRQIPGLPMSFQKKLCVDVARLIVFAFQQSILSLDQAHIWGHTLVVKPQAIMDSRFTIAANPDPRIKVEPRKSAVGEEQLAVLVDRMLENRAVSMAFLPKVFERRLYLNCMMVVFQLVEDLLSGDGEAITFMGHKLVFKLQPQPVRVLNQILEEHPEGLVNKGIDTVNDKVIKELVDELLQDSDTNIPWLPDMVEARIYVCAMRLLVHIIEHVVSRLRLNILGRDITFSLLSHLDKEIQKNRAKVTAAALQAEAQMYTEEEDPLRTMSTTELEERLKDLDQQRRTLEAIQGLGGADFNLTAEVPLSAMAGDERAKAAASVAASAMDEAASASPKIGQVPEAERDHEFARLAHTLKLGRSLSVVIEVDADISVPFSMIADVETYPMWMPWCTSGHVVDNDDAKAYREGGTADFDGKVGFGFETGTFLGTVGDTVNYRVSTRPPALDAEGAGLRSARVTADALNGFTYGKRLVYDWRFRELRRGKTKVELDMLFQAHSVLYMPVWDSMQSMVVNNMLTAFVNRAEQLQLEIKAKEAGEANVDRGSIYDLTQLQDHYDEPAAPR